MIAAKLLSIADTLRARGDCRDTLGPAECIAIAEAIRSLGSQCAQLEGLPVPMDRRQPIEPLRLVVGGKA